MNEWIIPIKKKNHLVSGKVKTMFIFKSKYKKKKL